MATLVLFALSPAGALAQGYGQWQGEGPSQGGGSSSGYQRKSSHGEQWRGDWKHQRPRSFGPDISAGTFQRPYPYHLDYYRMKYGGSYAPYFGNLYGPPTFVGVPWGFGNGTFFPSYGFNGYPPGGVGYPEGYGNPGPGPYSTDCVGPDCPDVGVSPNGPIVEGPAVPVAP